MSGPAASPTLSESLLLAPPLDRPFFSQDLLRAEGVLSAIDGRGAEVSRLARAERETAADTAAQAPANPPAGAAPSGLEDAGSAAKSAERGLAAAAGARPAVIAAGRVLLNGEAIEDVANGAAHNTTRSAKVIAGLGIGAGALQAAKGVRELANGEVASGSKDVAAGGLTTAAGAVELTATAAVAKRAVPVLAGAAGVVEGVSDLVEGVQKHDGEKAAVGGVKAVGGALLAASPWLAGTGVGAPVAIVAGVAGGVLLAGADAYELYGHYTRGASKP